MDAFEHSSSLLAMGRYREAKAEALEGLKRDPENPHLLCVLAHSLLGMNDPVQGHSFMTQAVALQPSNPELIAELGLFELAIGQYSKAVDTVRSARSINPDNRRVLLLSIQVLLADPALENPLKRTDVLHEARAVADGAIDAHPFDPSVHVAHGQVHIAAKDAAEAESSARRALELEPDNASALNLLSTALNKQGKSNDAGELRTQAMPAYPTSSNPMPEQRSLSAGRAVLAIAIFFVLSVVLAGIGGPALLVVPAIMAIAIGSIVMIGDFLSTRSNSRTVSDPKDQDPNDWKRDLW